MRVWVTLAALAIVFSATAALHAEDYEQGDVIVSDDGGMTITVVNPDCFESQKAAVRLRCTARQVDTDLTEGLPGRSVTLTYLRQANPGIDSFLVDGSVLPAWHMISTFVDSQ